MSSDVKALMEGGPERHWSERAACAGDDRFTGRFEELTSLDLYEMLFTCLSCPVRSDCFEWAEDLGAVEVFAAGNWRHGNGSDDAD